MQGWVGRAQQTKGGHFSVFGASVWLGKLTPLTLIREVYKGSRGGMGLWTQLARMALRRGESWGEKGHR